MCVRVCMRACVCVCVCTYVCVCVFVHQMYTCVFGVASAVGSFFFNTDFVILICIATIPFPDKKGLMGQAPDGYS